MCAQHERITEMAEKHGKPKKEIRKPKKIKEKS